jgi:uncharacterized YceG family protein
VSERTPEEREAARQERLRRRTGEIPAIKPDPAIAPPTQPDHGSAEPQLPQQERERPSGVRRGAAPAVSATADLPERAAAAGGRGAILARPPKRRRAGRRALLVVPALLLFAVLWVLFMTFQPFHGDGEGTIRVTIPKGATTSEIGELLEKRGVISSARYFGLRARLSGNRSDLKAGAFFLRKDMSNGAAIDALTENPIAPKVLKVVLPEGKSIREARPIVRDAGVRGPYRQAAIPKKRNPLLDQLGATPETLRSLEGLLFPATYELPVTGTAGQLVRKQLDAFKQNFSPSRAEASASCRGQNLTPYEVVIVASMVEREASLAKERPLIAGVICNRLQQGIPLGIDATIRYKVKNWTQPLKQSELAIDSKFNTRTNKGLPPTPIGSPGKASLDASLKPSDKDYLFYVVKPCGNGAHNFSRTDAEFQQDVAAYNKKRDELGGKDPSRC